MSKMKIVVAMNAFKGSLSSARAGGEVAKGFREAFPGAVIDVVPVADGGDGTIDCIAAAVESKKIRIKTAGPLGNPRMSEYLLIDGGKSAVVEMARASGLALLSDDERDPLAATTLGTGMLIRDAIRRGCGKVVVGIGGSATNDGGMGAAAAAGYKFLDKRGNELRACGAALEHVERIDDSAVPRELKKTKIIVACDVTNPLLGERGATKVYGPQKGATPVVARRLEAGMKNFARVAEKHFGRDFSGAPGAGAAGGLGFGLMTFFGAKLVSGIDMMISVSNLDGRMKGAALLITGEGRMDSQSAQGKAPFGLLKLAKKNGVPAIAFCGAVSGEKQLLKAGFKSVVPITDRPMTLEQAMAEGGPLLYRAALRTALLIRDCEVKR